MAYGASPAAFNNPIYFDDPLAPALPPGALSGAADPLADPLARAAPAAPPGAPPGPLSGAAPAGPLSGLSGLFGPATGGLADFLKSGVAAGVGGALLAGHGLPTYLGTQVPQIAADAQRRAAVNAWLKSQSGLNLSPEEQNLLQSDPQLAENIATYRLTPHPLVVVPPGSSMANPLTGQIVGGGPHRGDGSAYDLENAQKYYKTKYGEGANVDVNAPDFSAWYRSGWPTEGYDATPGGAAPAPSPPSGAAGATATDTSGAAPSAAPSAAPPATPATAAGGTAAGGLPPRGETDQSIVRQERISSNLAKPIADTPIYKLVSNGGPYLARIHAAAQAAAQSSDKSPGALSIIDQELLDSITKLNTGGGQVTEAQVNLVTKGASITDKINVFKNYMNGQGGILSDPQRAELVKLADQVFTRYQEGYKPYYEQYVKTMKANGVPPYRWTLPDVTTLSSQGKLASDNSGGGGATIQEGQTATNPATGHRIMNRGGQLIDLTTGQPLQQ